MLFNDTNITIADILDHEAFVNDRRLFGILTHFNFDPEDKQKILNVVNDAFNDEWMGRVVIRMTSTLDHDGFVIPIVEFRGIQSPTHPSSPVVDIYYGPVQTNNDKQWPKLDAAIVMDSNEQFALAVEERQHRRIEFK